MSNKTLSTSSKQTFSIGVPRPELTNDWWKTFTAIPASENPLAIGATVDDIRQPGNVHFLGGWFGVSDSVTRDVAVADNQTVVFPILTSGADNVGWNFSDPNQPAYIGNGSFSGLPVPYQFSTKDLQILGDAIMDTASNVSLEVNGDSLISDANEDQYRQASQGRYNLNLPPKDDILGYRAAYPAEWVKPPYTQGVQDGIWVELKHLPLGENTIHFAGHVNYGDIEVKDWNNSHTIGDSPLEYLAEALKGIGTVSLDVTYHVTVLSRPEYNSYLAANFGPTSVSPLAI